MKTIEVYEQTGHVYATNGVMIAPMGSVEVINTKGTNVVKQAIDLKEAGFTADEIFKLLKKVEEQ